MPHPTFHNLPQEKRQHLLQKAIKAFALAPYEKVSMSQLAQDIGIAKGSLYQYFVDKRELYLYLVQLAGEEKLAYLQRVEPPSPQKGLFPYLRWMLEQTLDFQFEHPHLAQLAYRALYGDRPLPDETLKTTREASVRYFGELIKLGIIHGDVRSDIDQNLAAVMLSGLFSEIGQHLITSLNINPAELSSELADQELARQARESIFIMLNMIEHGIGTHNQDTGESK